MAITAESLFGKFSGRLGNVVIYEMNGKIVVRARPGKRSKPAEGKQKETQDNFARVMSVLRSVKPYLIAGFIDVSKGRYVFQTALSENLKSFYDSSESTDFGWLILSKGERAGAIDLQLEAVDEQAVVHWGDPEPGKPHDKEDRVMLLAINTGSMEASWNMNAGKRADSQAIIKIPAAQPGEKTLVFISFKDLAGSMEGHAAKNTSNSQLAG